MDESCHRGVLEYVSLQVRDNSMERVITQEPRREDHGLVPFNILIRIKSFAQRYVGIVGMLRIPLTEHPRVDT